MNGENKRIPNTARENIKKVEQENNIKLSTIQKILCSIEGPVVSILDVLYGEINPFILDQHIEKADKQIAEKLEINEGDEVDIREVILHKHGRPFVYGLSYIPKDRCSNTIIEKLLREDRTTGRILLEHEIETITKIKDISLEKPTPTLETLFHTKEDMITREFILIHKKNIVIWSKEMFPKSLFLE